MEHEIEPYANAEIPATLAERIHYQKGSPKLDLSLCYIEKVPLKGIRDYYGDPIYMDLSYNTIRSLSHRFSPSFLQLTKLDLSKNLLKRLPENFGLMKELMYLDLHNNALKVLPLSMGKMAKLQYLDISNNDLRPPLSHFLGDHCYPSADEDISISAVAVAELVTRFLREMDAQLSLSFEHIIPNEVPSYRIHYRSRSRTNGSEEVRSISDDDINSPKTIRIPLKRTLKSTPLIIGGVLGFWIVSVGVLMSLSMNDHYFELFARATKSIPLVGLYTNGFMGRVVRPALSLLGLNRGIPWQNTIQHDVVVAESSGEDGWYSWIWS